MAPPHALSSPEDAGHPNRKRQKVEGGNASNQTSLLNFFSKPKAEKKEQKETPESGEKDEKKDGVPDPIVPQQTQTPRGASWSIQHGCVLVRTTKEAPRTKVAGFDMDGTLFVWRCPGWPSKFGDYELWSADLPEKFRQLHDDGYKLVVFSNQGGIRKALQGKTATRARALVDWLAKVIDRPLHAVMSADKKSGYHKPSPSMWEICEQYCNGGVEATISSSFFVGDSVGDEDPQGGVDEKFAANIASLKGMPLKFSHPETFFGPSDSEKRKKSHQLSNQEATPPAALKAQAAISGGYLSGPVMIVLSGVQGSGKSTFCRMLMENNNNNNNKHWVHLSQDTINKGKPGKREKVEEEAAAALRKGQSVVIDRMHLDELQRSYFVQVAKSIPNAAVHSVLLSPARDVVARRVRERTNHPAGVEGEKGAKMAVASMGRLVPPRYKEGFDLVTKCCDESSVQRVCQLYRTVGNSVTPSLPESFTIAPNVEMPSVCLGTMKIGKRLAKDVIPKALEVGWKGVDTAPTYKNEAEVGASMKEKDIFCIAKVPKKATTAEQVRQELTQTLANLNRDRVDLLLLHWPCDVMEAGTLQSVWKEMESCLAEGLCRSIGVCNFSVGALGALLPHCSIPPAVNQIERHPRLPQWDLVHFCQNNGIHVQAHTPLGGGRLLDNTTLKEVADKAGLSAAQVALCWNLRHGVAVTPKCASKEHLLEAMDVFSSSKKGLCSEHMKALDAIEESGRKRFVEPPFMTMRRNALYSW